MERERVASDENSLLSNGSENMGNECNHNCEGCSENCSSRGEIVKEKLMEGSRVGKLIAVVSGKGGVGKSFVTGLLASGMNKLGKKTAILDGDVTGPSVPRMFGVTEHAAATEDGTAIIPAVSDSGVKLMSANLLLASENDPVLWRGPMIADMVTRFWTEVQWGDVDYMFVDMPPGTGDVPLTVFQSLPVDGIVVVTSPQELVSMIVEKAVKMARMMNVPIVGVVENMSFVKCPCCGKEIEVFGKSNIRRITDEFGLRLLARIPIDPEAADACDHGRISSVDSDCVTCALNEIQSL